MTDLGTVSGDALSIAYGVNLEGQVVGWSSDACECQIRAFLWQNGVMTDLNTLIPANSPVYLNYAFGINDEGQIVGGGTTTSGEYHGYLATPSYGQAESENATMAASTELPSVKLLENVRKMLQRRVRVDAYTPSAQCKEGRVTPR